MLGEGDSIPADGRLLAAASLRVAEASLTGESVPVGKNVDTLAEAKALGDRANMVFNGTSVTQGTGRANRDAAPACARRSVKSRTFCRPRMMMTVRCRRK